MQKGFILIAAIFGMLFSTAVIDPVSATSKAPRRVEVTAKKFSFEPAEITVQKGQAVDLVVKSTDVAHGLKIRELNLDIKVNKGATADAQFTPDKTGTFVGHCSVFCGSGHGRMTLTIRVVE
jgi:cytochrome c oxidase subunit 2